MSIIESFKRGVKTYKSMSEQRAVNRLESAKTKSAREKELAKIKRENLKTKREISQAKTALLRAEAQRKKAAKQVKDIGGGSVYSQIQDFLYPKPKRRTTRRKVRKTTSRRK